MLCHDSITVSLYTFQRTDCRLFFCEKRHIVIGFNIIQSIHAEWDCVPAKPSYRDWIQLTSGEWLKGDIIARYNDVMEFDSDQRNTLTLDMVDIKCIRRNIMIVGEKCLNGELVLDGDSI